jgi:hypothetical protein
MKRTLYRAADEDYVDTGYSFAETRSIAEAYLDNPGFGGCVVFKARVDYRPDEVIDLTRTTVARAAKRVGHPDPGAIGIDEWLPRTPDALTALREQGFLWALVAESFPHDTTTWIWLGTGLDEEPELVEA